MLVGEYLLNAPLSADELGEFLIPPVVVVVVIVSSPENDSLSLLVVERSVPDPLGNIHNQQGKQVSEPYPTGKAGVIVMLYGSSSS